MVRKLSLSLLCAVLLALAGTAYAQPEPRRSLRSDRSCGRRPDRVSSSSRSITVSNL
jgi:hypothetical protein